jgi:phospholipid-translocating ATPase
LANEGLRTLVFAQKILSEDQAQQFMEQLKQSQQKLEGRDQHILKTVNKLEKDMDLLGVSGVEDSLQNNVERTIGSLKQAGIQVWMLTGDKIETATSIAISSGLK